MIRYVGLGGKLSEKQQKFPEMVLGRQCCRTEVLAAHSSGGSQEALKTVPRTHYSPKLVSHFSACLLAFVLWLLRDSILGLERLKGHLWEKKASLPL